MPRLQILELPEGSGDDRPPFVLVIDQLPDGDDAAAAIRRDLRQGDIPQLIDARAVLCFEGTMDIPANETTVDADGHPVKLRLEPDFTGWDDALTTALARVHDAIGQNFALKIGEMEIGEQALIQTRNGPRPGKVVGRSAADESGLDELRTMVQEEIAKAQTELVDSLKRGLLR
ncbi:hypothetical protein [Streptomyces sp. NPDC005732]|uniref:hypothetical protein n=1 Tax=Streptomyces sp. NPDC005732 TaxID=3157057 RepID=UPI0033CF9966